MTTSDQNSSIPDPEAEPTYRRELGGGLVLRWSTGADAAGVGRLMGLVESVGPDEPFNARVMDGTLRRMSGTFPLMGPGDVAVVEDTCAPDRPIVACAGLWRETWEYAGVPFEVGRPEDVATHPDYRNRGLVRAMFELLHARCAAEGRPVQAITGIPHIYRQLGYEYALAVRGRRVSFLALIPPAKPNEPQPYALREAELLKRWWVPKSMGMTLLSCEVDARVGGTYRLVFDAVPEPAAFFGTYVEVTPYSRLAWTNDEGGEGGSVTTVTFEEKGGKTLVVLCESYPSKEALDAAGTGAADAMVETFDQLDELLVALGESSGQ